MCPDGDRNDFLIVAQSSYALGDFSLDEAVDNAEQSICPAVEVDAEASPTTTRQSTDSGGGLDLVMAGWLTVCTDVPYPPMELKDPSAEGGFTGFDIELMRAIANDLGLDLAIATPGWDAIISGLATEAGDCDISAAAITLDESRRGIDFSEPYFENRQSLLVADDSTAATLADLDIVAAANGDYGEFWLRYNTPAGVNVVVFDDIGAMYLAFEAGEVDGVVTSIIGSRDSPATGGKAHRVLCKRRVPRLRRAGRGCRSSPRRSQRIACQIAGRRHLRRHLRRVFPRRLETPMPLMHTDEESLALLGRK